jgi:hypothetical protein
MISLRLKVRFAADEDYGRLRDLLKTQAKLAGLEIRKRPDGAEIVGPYVESALLLLSPHGFDVVSL